MTQEFTEAEIQVLIAVLELNEPIETPNNIGYNFYPKTLEQAATYFRKSKVDWSEAINNMKAANLLNSQREHYILTEQGTAYAHEFRQARPPLWYWYLDFYTAIANSQTHALYCELLFGKNLCQDGFMDMKHLQQLLDMLCLKPETRVLDLGCGNGHIAEYISDTTGANVWGIDYIPEAIQQAQKRTEAKEQRLFFKVGNLDCIDFPDGYFDAVISIDTLYMPTNLTETVRQIKNILKPGGQMGIFYSHVLWGNSSQTPETLQPDKTPVGIALKNNNLPFQARDFTQAAYQHARHKKQIAEEMRSAFEAEGNGFLSEVQLGEAEGTIHSVEAERYARYLYHVVYPAG